MYIIIMIIIVIINVLYTLELAGRHSSIWNTWCGCPTPSLELANGPGRNCQLHPQIQGWSDALNLNPSTSDVSFAELVLHCPGILGQNLISDYSHLLCKGLNVCAARSGTRVTKLTSGPSFRVSGRYDRDGAFSGRNRWLHRGKGRGTFCVLFVALCVSCKLSMSSSAFAATAKDM